MSSKLETDCLGQADWEPLSFDLSEKYRQCSGVYQLKKAIVTLVEIIHYSSDVVFVVALQKRTAVAGLLSHNSSLAASQVPRIIVPNHEPGDGFLSREGHLFLL